MQTYDDATGPFAFQMLQLAKLQANPSTIYTSSKSDKLFLDKLRDSVDGVSGTAQHQIRIEKASLFSLDHALRLLQNVQVRGMSATLSGTDRLHVLNTHIHLAATQQVCAAGALLAILHREGHLSSRQAEDSGDMPAAMLLEGLSEISLDGFLTVDFASMLALQIFQEDKHPSAMGIGKSKEGFSVYGMLNSCVSSMGRRLLRLWFLRPIINIDVLNQRQDAVHFFMHAPDVIKSVKTVLRKTRDILQLLRRLQATQGLLDVKDFSQIQESIANLLMLRDIFASLASTHAQPPSANLHSGFSTETSSGWTTSNPQSEAFDSPTTPQQSFPRSGCTTNTASDSRQRPSIIQKVLACTGNELLTCKLWNCFIMVMQFLACVCRLCIHWLAATYPGWWSCMTVRLCPSTLTYLAMTFLGSALAHVWDATMSHCRQMLLFQSTVQAHDPVVCISANEGAASMCRPQPCVRDH